MKNYSIFCLFFVFATLAVAQTSDTTKGNHPLMITKDGIDSITKGTKYDVNQIKKIFSSYLTKTLQDEEEGDFFQAGRVQVFSDKELLLEIYPVSPREGKTISSIVVFSNQIKNSFGIKIGDTFQQVFHGEIPSHCHTFHHYGDEPEVICNSSDELKNITYSFKGSWPPGMESEETLPSNLKSFQLNSIAWEPQN